MDDRDPTLLISINRVDLDQANWWRNIWHGQGFESWADARGWLWDDYRAEVYKTKDGFEIRFMYLDEATLFRLTWL
jgi:hypothetical protein